MTTAPEIATFSIERDGEEYDVHVPRALVATADGGHALTDETMAEWLQDNLAALSDIAHRKLDDGGASSSAIEITVEDWADNRSR
jgi:hypothetical protein